MKQFIAEPARKVLFCRDTCFLIPRMVLRNKASQVTKENICFVVRPTQPAYKFSTGKTCSHEHRDGLAQLFIHPRKKGEPNLKKNIAAVI